jgi:hypothetical protein
MGRSEMWIPGACSPLSCGRPAGYRGAVGPLIPDTYPTERNILLSRLCGPRRNEATDDVKAHVVFVVPLDTQCQGRTDQPKLKLDLFTTTPNSIQAVQQAGALSRAVTQTRAAVAKPAIYVSVASISQTPFVGQNPCHVPEGRPIISTQIHPMPSTLPKSKPCMHPAQSHLRGGYRKYPYARFA